MSIGASAGSNPAITLPKSYNPLFPYFGTIKLHSCKLTALGSIRGEIRLTVHKARVELKGDYFCDINTLLRQINSFMRFLHILIQL